MTEPKIPLDYDKIKAFCEKWKIVEFSLFGSIEPTRRAVTCYGP